MHRPVVQPGEELPSLPHRDHRESLQVEGRSHVAAPADLLIDKAHAGELFGGMEHWYLLGCNVIIIIFSYGCQTSLTINVAHTCCLSMSRTRASGVGCNMW